MNTSKYPIYIISKGRWERRQTIKTLNSMNVFYRVVVEPGEYDEYKRVVNEKQIIVCPENFSEKGNGSIPVRNFVFEHSEKEGHKKHWILDDNLESVERYNNNMKVPCKSISPFLACENFTDRYKNIGLSGMNYASFCPASDGRPPFQINTRVYSCILVNNEIPFRWRGRYNEDTDLSLRVLKYGWNTILFNAFLIGKRATMCQKGGNEQIYNDSDNRKEFAESLKNQHPDLVDVVWRFERWHHQVNYKPFKNRNLEYKDDYVVPENKINNYKMKLYRSKKRNENTQ